MRKKTFISTVPKLWGITIIEIAAIVGKDEKTASGYYLKPNLSEAKVKIIEAENRALMMVL